uniref:Uncharacterized protein n=1 Tax=Peronospora matthiolae TaxID=2874970 RepID=A0AAV1UF85_9STRA
MGWDRVGWDGIESLLSNVALGLQCGELQLTRQTKSDRATKVDTVTDGRTVCLHDILNGVKPGRSNQAALLRVAVQEQKRTETKRDATGLEHRPCSSRPQQQQPKERAADSLAVAVHVLERLCTSTWSLEPWPAQLQPGADIPASIKWTVYQTSTAFVML